MTIETLAGGKLAVGDDAAEMLMVRGP